MIQAENIYNHIDRNGYKLSYGDKVLVHAFGKICIATIIGFTPRFVCMIWCVGSGNTFTRESHNVVYVKDIDYWKENI